MALSLRRLEALFWVARLGSFRAAARHLNVSQPTVSQRVRELEAELGSQLIDRGGGASRPTRQGATVLHSAERILELASEVESVGKAAADLSGVLRIGAADTFAMTHLPALVAKLEARYPNLLVELQVRHSRLLNRALAARELDVAFLTHPESAEDMVTVPLEEIHLGWVAGPGVDLPGRVAPGDLRDVQIITNPPPSHLDTTIRAWFAGAGFRPRRISTCDTLSIIVRLVTANVGVSLLPLGLLEAELASGALRTLRAAPMISPHTLCGAYPRGEAGPAMDAVIDQARAIIGGVP